MAGRSHGDKLGAPQRITVRFAKAAASLDVNVCQACFPLFQYPDGSSVVCLGGELYSHPWDFLLDGHAAKSAPGLQQDASTADALKMPEFLL